eukprot:6177834-Pleurochrysis_carterae.AAC.1
MNVHVDSRYRMQTACCFNLRSLTLWQILHMGLYIVEGVEQTDRALRALEPPRRQTDPRLKEEEELALKQVISSIIPEWQETDNKWKKGVIALFRLETMDGGNDEVGENTDENVDSHEE